MKNYLKEPFLTIRSALSPRFYFADGDGVLRRDCRSGDHR